MRYGVVAAMFLSAVLLLPWSDAHARTNAGNYEGSGGYIAGGTPVAVAVRGVSGSGATYERPGAGSGSRWTCSYHEVGVFGASLSIADESLAPVDGGFYAFLCYDQDGVRVREDYLTYAASDPLAGILAAERAAEQAMERLGLPLPAINLNPPGRQVVGIPTWLAVGDPWIATEASASVAGVTSTVTARPTSVHWDLGDGTSITCAGPGAAFDVTRPRAGQASDCTHTYTWSSHTSPGGVYQVVATVSYAVTWSASTGASGDLGVVTRATTVPVRVLEVQAVGR